MTGATVAIGVSEASEASDLIEASDPSEAIEATEATEVPAVGGRGLPPGLTVSGIRDGTTRR